MFEKPGYRRLVLCSYVAALLLLMCGCHGRRGKSVVDLYVDAVMLNELQKHDEAVDNLDKAVEKNENFSLAYSLRGDIHQQMGRYEESADSYQKASELNPWSFHDFFNLGKVYQTMKRFARAVKAYVRACELQPDHLQAHINTAKCYSEIEQYDSALLYGQRAEQINPDVVELQEILGDIYESKKDHEQAISSYKRALELENDNPRVITSLAIAYLRAEQIEPAKELLTLAVDLDPQNGRAYRHLAYCYLQLYDRRAQAYREASETGNADQNYLNSLREIRRQMVEMAIENYNSAIEIDESDWDAYRGLGVACIIKGKTDGGTVDRNLKDKAILYWRTSLQINPDQPRADRLRGLIAKYRRE
jgi:tetratricopeptide (TPR) repeat protein